MPKAISNSNDSEEEKVGNEEKSKENSEDSLAAEVNLPNQIVISRNEIYQRNSSVRVSTDI